MSTKKISGGMPLHSKLAYTFGAFGNDVFYFTLSTYLINFITSSLIKTGDPQLDQLLVGIITTIIMVLRIVELLIDPFIGNAVDRTNTRWGHFRPWIVIGGVVSSVILAVMFVDFDWVLKSSPWLYLALFAVLYITMDIFYSFKDIAFWSMLPALTLKSREREKTATIARIGSTVGGSLVGVVIMPIVLFFSIDKAAQNGDPNGWMWFGIVVGAVSLISAVCVGLFTKEKEHALRQNKEHTKGIKEVFKVLAKNDQLMWTALSYILYCVAIYVVNSLELYYFQFIIGSTEGFSILQTINMFVGIVSVFVFPILTKMFKRKKVFAFCFISMLVGLLIFAFAGENLALVLVAAEFFFIPQPIVWLVILMTITDSVEYGQLKTGHRDESLTLSLRPLCDKFGSAISNGIVGQTAVIAGMTGGATGASLAASGVFAFKILMFLVPAIILVIAGAVYLKKVKLDEKMHKEIYEKLKKTWPKGSK